MKITANTSKSVEQAARDFEAAIVRNGFGVLHVYDLKQTLAAKGAPIDSECRIFDVCNPVKARAVLTEDMSLNMALPCRVSVYEQDGQTVIGMLSPRAMLASLSESPDLAALADDVEATLLRAIEQAV